MPKNKRPVRYLQVFIFATRWELEKALADDNMSAAETTSVDIRTAESLEVFLCSQDIETNFPDEHILYLLFEESPNSGAYAYTKSTVEAKDYLEEKASLKEIQQRNSPK